MTYTRIYADAEGETHFEDVDVNFLPADFAPPAPAANLSPFEAAQQAGFHTAPPGWDGASHVAPVKAYYISITGTWEITTSDGRTLRFGPGSVIRAQDTSGKGHASRVVSETEALAAVIQLPD